MAWPAGPPSFHTVWQPCLAGTGSVGNCLCLIIIRFHSLSQLAAAHESSWRARVETGMFRDTAEQGQLTSSSRKGGSLSPHARASPAAARGRCGTRPHSRPRWQSRRCFGARLRGAEARLGAGGRAGSRDAAWPVAPAFSGATPQMEGPGLASGWTSAP